MPRGDRSGPAGIGPRSGRAAGYCANYDTPGFMSRFFGRGTGRGSGMGNGQGLGQNRGSGSRGGCFGWRNMFHRTGLRRSNLDSAGFGRQAGKPGWMRFSRYFGQQSNTDTAMEKQTLKDQADVLKSELDRVQSRLNDLESAASDK